MPKYEYKCKVCSEHFFIRHGISEKITRKPDCKKQCILERIPTLSFRKPQNKKSKAGNVVKKYIEDTKKEIEVEKEKMKEEFNK